MLKRLKLKGSTRNVLLTAARAKGPRNFDVLFALMKLASWRYRYLLYLPRIMTTTAVRYPVCPYEFSDDEKEIWLREMDPRYPVISDPGERPDAPDGFNRDVSNLNPEIEAYKWKGASEMLEDRTFEMIYRTLVQRFRDQQQERDEKSTTVRKVGKTEETVATGENGTTEETVATGENGTIEEKVATGENGTTEKTVATGENGTTEDDVAMRAGEEHKAPVVVSEEVKGKRPANGEADETPKTDAGKDEVGMNGKIYESPTGGDSGSASQSGQGGKKSGKGKRKKKGTTMPLDWDFYEPATL